jgi:hypothetical protein
MVYQALGSMSKRSKGRADVRMPAVSVMFGEENKERRVQK